MTVERILVQVANRGWTLEATHLACQIARLRHASIIFVKMVPVQHPGWLGTEFGDRSLTPADYANLCDNATAAEDYGVPYSAECFQYLTLIEAICDAADHFEAELVFATSLNRIEYLRRFQNSLLAHLLANHHRQLATPQVTAALLSDKQAVSSFPQVAHVSA